MVKKLFKHEFISYIRIMGVVYALLLFVATAGRIIQLFESDSIPYNIISVFSVLGYIVSVIAAFGFAAVLAVVRFYKNLFTCEGYLTLTLPVTASQHILVKATTAVCTILATFVVVFLSICIFTAGETCAAVFHEISMMLKFFFDGAGFHAVLIILELIILMVMALFSGVMLYYTFISIGQLFKKNRILAAVGAYFAYYMFNQVLSSILLIVFTVLAQTESFGNFMAKLSTLVYMHPYATYHIGSFTVMLLGFGWIALEFFVIKTIITKKLNLE